MARDLTLDDVVDQLKDNNREVSRVGRAIENYFTKMERMQLKELEAKREAKRTAPKAQQRKGDSMLQIIANPKKMKSWLLGINKIKLIAASVLAFGAAIAGLRGWEVLVLKNLRRILTKTLPNFVINGVTKLRNGIYRFFGLTPKGQPEIDPKTKKFMARRPISEQIMGKFTDLRNRIMGFFGMNPDGSVKPVQGQSGKFIKNPAGPITKMVQKLITPIQAMASGIGAWMTGAGKGIMTFIKPFLGAATGFAKLFGKILWPIGVLFSLFDGVKAWQAGEGKGLLDRIGDGVGAFLGDFIGAPFDLLKAGINWIFDKIFGVQRDENGKVLGDGWASWASRAMGNFSFEKTIRALIDAPFNMVQTAVDWVKELFVDPKVALTKLWEGLLGTGGKLLDILWWPVNTAIDWVLRKFGWSDEDTPKFSLRLFIKEKFWEVVDMLGKTMDTAINWIKSVPTRVMFYLEEKWITTKDTLTKGILEFANYISSIPDRIYANILETLNGTMVGDYLVDDDAITAARARIDSRNAMLRDQIKYIDDQTAVKLMELKARREAFEADQKAAGLVVQDNSSTDASQSVSARIGVQLGGLDPLDPNYSFAQ